MQIASTASHGHCVRLAAGADVPAIERRLAAAASCWWPAVAEPSDDGPIPPANGDSPAGRWRLWVEPVPAAAGSELAQRLRDRELRRPAVDTGPPRAVLLSYVDGAADLVLVGHRAVLDPRSLRLVADVLTGAAEPGSVNIVPGGLGGTVERLSWGLGAAAAGDRTGAETAVVTVPLPGTPEDVRTHLAAAADLVVGCYQDGEPADDARPHGILYDALQPAAGLVLPCQAPPWPLTLVPRGSAGGQVTLELHHWLRDLDSAAARRVADQLAHVYPQVRDGAAEITMLDDAEAARQLALGVVGAAPKLPGPQRIDTAFAARAAHQPDAAALVCGTESLTYRELDARADRLAAGLLALGAEPGDRIGVCLDRSIDLVVSILAVLKADGVYVPLDPAYPADRLAYTVDDAALRVVVTDMADFPAADRMRAVRPAELAELAGDAPGSPRRDADAAAYVIYTSGSTGRPKGVVVAHRSVLDLLAGTTADFGLGPDDTWPLFHSSAFDVSVWEMWASLLTGARLVVVPYWVSRSPEDFHDLLCRERVTVLNQTPSAFAPLMAVDRERESRPPLRLVIFAGEPLDTRALVDWFDRYPEERCRLVNMFGITETTVHVTAQTVTRREALAGSRSVGRPIPGWYARILDERGRPVPNGVAGEIYVGGAGVALEYLGRPELTAERFLRDPYGGDDAARLYRSGDAGRFLPDGRIEHLGRLDNQVKVRGFRIELDEIRNVLLLDPAVTSAAVVVANRADPELARLDAYVVLGDRRGADWVSRVRGLAVRMLPEYMVPATFTAVPELPLTVNGKLDPRRLPEPARENSGARPGAGGAAALAEVWEAVLGVPVGIDDNFFRLGGNSLAAVRVRTAMRARGLPELTLRQIYLTPTIRTLAEKLGVSAAAQGKAHDVQ